jgi:hypothetical protein
MANNQSSTNAEAAVALCNAQIAYFNAHANTWAVDISQLSPYVNLPLTLYVMIQNDEAISFYNYLPSVEKKETRLVAELNKITHEITQYAFDDNDFSLYIKWVRHDGVSGYSGYSGASGWSGYSGEGFNGTSGMSGYSGFVGSTGQSGFSGFVGSTGQSGFSGFVGNSGYSGIGTSGYSGSIGYSGTSGNQGSSGYSGNQITILSTLKLSDTTRTSGWPATSPSDDYDGLRLDLQAKKYRLSGYVPCTFDAGISYKWAFTGSVNSFFVSVFWTKTCKGEGTRVVPENTEFS